MSTRRFGYTKESVSEARTHLRRVLEDQPQELVDVAELLTSELATNAIRHGASGFELKIEVDESIRLEVRDTGVGRPAVVAAGPHDSSGRGLGIVEALSSAWGVISSSVGKTVWCELPIPRVRGGSARRVSVERLAGGASSPRRGAGRRSAAVRPDPGGTTRGTGLSASGPRCQRVRAYSVSPKASRSATTRA
jgi:anti-sigma regulatory factor (Ser/Thr protein kinase)